MECSITSAKLEEVTGKLILAKLNASANSIGTLQEERKFMSNRYYDLITENDALKNGNAKLKAANGSDENCK